MTESVIPNQYVCELCKKEFIQKIDYTRHKNKKSPCISIDAIKTLTQEQDIKTDTKGKLTTTFKYCLDVLRDNEHLTGDKALRTLAHLLDLRLLESQFGTKIDIEGNHYNFSDYEDSCVEQHKAKLFKIVKFSNLAKEPVDNIPLCMKALWDEILSVHPITKNIFLKGKGFDIQRQSTYKKVIDKLFEFKFEDMDNDILGEAYEEVIKDVMIGKTLGQFFTPPCVKQMMVELIDPQIKIDGTCETIFDPAMGTGGFLITCIRHLIKKSKTLNIELNWDHIINTGIGGREPEPDTYQLAVSNMLIASGHMLKHLEKGDSIRETITNKYDIILANPPFGIKGLNYFEITSSLRNEYLPINSNSAVPLFIQAIIYMLNIDGRCAVVLPEGQELFSKNRTLAAVREFLMKTCDLKEVIYLPAGTFTHTSIKTCVLYFHKKKAGTDVLKVDIKISPTTQQEIQRDYKFSATHQTHKVAFYDYNPSNRVKHLHLEVDITDIAKKGYSLNYAEYLKDETEEAVYEEGIIVKTLGELFKLNGNGKTNSGDITNSGEYPFYKASCLNPSGTHNTYDFNGKEYLLIVKSGGSSSKPISADYGIGKVFLVNGKCAANIAVFQLLPTSVNNIRYLYRYLLYIQPYIQKLAKYCTNNGNIDMNELMQIKIPIPPLEKQLEIVKYMDFVYETVNKSSEQKIKELQKLTEYCLTMQKEFGLNSIKPLGEVCVFIKTGKNKTTDNKNGTLYPYYGTGSITGYTDEYLFDGKFLLTARNGTIGNCFLTDGKFFPSDHMFVIDIPDKCLMKYIYYILSDNKKLDSLKTGVGIPNITKSVLESFKIPIPDIERQKEIVEYCEFNDNLIKQLEREIEQNKKQAQIFLSNIIKVVGTKPQQDPATQLQETEPNLTVPVDNNDTEPVISSPEEQQSPVIIDSAKFDQSYLAQLNLTDLKQMKKLHKIRAKVTAETIDEYVRILHEWYVTQSTKTKKHAKKTVVTQQPVESVTNISNTILTLDLTIPNA